MKRLRGRAARDYSRLRVRVHDDGGGWLIVVDVCFVGCGGAVCGMICGLLVVCVVFALIALFGAVSAVFVCVVCVVHTRQFPATMHGVLRADRVSVSIQGDRYHTVPSGCKHGRTCCTRHPAISPSRPSYTNTTDPHLYPSPRPTPAAHYLPRRRPA